MKAKNRKNIGKIQNGRNGKVWEPKKSFVAAIKGKWNDKVVGKLQTHILTWITFELVFGGKL